jgi:phosphoribosylformylglycinamidine synthase
LKTEEVKVCVLRIEGTNCEQEMFDTFARLGASPELVHLNQLVKQDLDASLRRSLLDYNILALPGGFSAGDYIRAGSIFAARVLAGIGDDLKAFVKDGRPVLGVCNGFQVLVELGLLPDGIDSFGQPHAVLHINDSNRFECRPTLLKQVNKERCIFTSKVEPGSIRQIPSAHGEGKLTFALDEQEKILDRLEENDQIVFRYCDEVGDTTAGYPWNPNGVARNVAGICDPTGTIFGMMPHPERAYYRWQRSDWTRLEGDPQGEGDGKAVFTSVLDHVERKF